MSNHYYLYFDDSGARHLDRKSGDPGPRFDYYALGGILIRNEDRDSVIESHRAFCNSWGIDYPLRSFNIRHQKKEFKWLRNRKKRKFFTKELRDFLNKLPVIGIAAVIHRPGYNNRFKATYADDRWPLAKTALPILIERSTKYAMNNNAKLTVRFEKCNPTEDKEMIEYAKKLKKENSQFDKENSKKYSPLSKEDFKNTILGDLKAHGKKHPLLQIADLYLYPMAINGYDTCRPYEDLLKNKRIIDAFLDDSQIESCGIKYSCFDDYINK